MRNGRDQLDFRVFKMLQEGVTPEDLIPKKRKKEDMSPVGQKKPETVY